MVFIKLILAHLIGDFVLQPKSWVRRKETAKAKSVYLYLHGFIHGALVWLLLFDFRYWALALTITGIHILIDMAKLYLQKENNKVPWFLLDQFLHLLSLLAVWYFFFSPALSVFPLLENPAFWVYVTAILFLTAVCGILIQVLLTNWAKSIEFEKSKSLPNAGKYIGILERLLVFIFVISGHWEAIGFLVAAKSVFRFSDLKDARDRKMTEYILIGTLLSFGIAILVGIGVLGITEIL